MARRDGSATAAPRRGRLRRFGGWSLFVLLVFVVLLQSAYLLRRPLFEQLIRDQVGALLGDLLDGEVRLGPIGGSWITGLDLREVEITAGGPLRQLRNGRVQVELDPLRLARGDLSGLLQVKVSADAVHLDFAAGGGEAAEPTEPGQPPDIAALLRMLPEGAEVSIDDLRLSGPHGERAGPARVRLEPVAVSGPSRRLAVALPGLQLAATMRAGRGARADLVVRDLSGVPRMFAPLQTLAGGDALIGVAIDTLIPFRARANLRVEHLSVQGREVRQLEATGRIDTDGLADLSLAVRAPGLDLQADGVSLHFDDALATLAGELSLDLRDLEPYSEFLPAEVRAQMPIGGSLLARAGDGRLSIGGGRFHSRSADLRLSAGAVRFTGGDGLSVDSPVRAELVLRRPELLPLPADLPVRPLGGRVGVLLRRGRADGGLLLETSVAVDLTDGDGRTGRLEGSADIERGDVLAVRPDLVLTGGLLHGAATSLRLHGSGELRGAEVVVPELRLDVDGAAQKLRVAGRAPWDAADLDTMLRDTQLTVTIDALPLGAFAAFAEGAPTGGSVSGAVTSEAGALRVDLRIEATGLPTLPADASARAELVASMDDTALQLERVYLEAPYGHVDVSGSVRGLGSSGLLRGELVPEVLTPAIVAGFAFADLARVDLEPLAGLALRGALRGSVTVGGTLAAPTVAADLEPRDLAVAGADGDLVAGVGGRLQLLDRALRVDELRALLLDNQLQLDGVVALLDERVEVRDLRVGDDRGGSMVFVADVARAPLEAGDWKDLLRTSDVDIALNQLSLAPWLDLGGMKGADGRADGRVQWKPREAKTLSVRLDGAAQRVPAGDRTVELRLRAAIEGDEDGIRLTELNVESDQADVRGTGSLDISPLQIVDDPERALDAALALDLQVPATDLESLPSEMLGFARLRGELTATFHVAGTVKEPVPTAEVDLTGGTLIAADGQRLDDVSAHIVLAQDRVRLEPIAASRGRGPFEVTGTFTAPGPLWRDWRRGTADLAVTGDGVLLHRQDGVKVRADLDVKIQGPLSDMSITGKVSLRDSKLRSRIPLLDWRSTSGRSTTSGIVIPGLDLGPDIGGHLDVRLVTAEPFEIGNNVLDGQLVVELALRGPLAQPVLEGTVSGPEARILLPGIRLRATTLLVEFKRGDPHFPVITVNATGRRLGFDVQVIVRGRYDSPEVLLSSDPPLPPDHVIVLITTGTLPANLRGTQGVGTVLGAYLAQELADWIFGSESTEAKEGFLDRFTLETGAEMSQNGTQSIVVEFRLLDNVYLQGERDVYEDLNMGVVYRVRLR